MLAAFILLLSTFPPYGFSDEHKGGENLLPVSNELYKKTCGACHFAHQPGLLPERSWKKIMDSPGTHFGGALSLDDRTKEKIRKYLVHNCAENSPSKRSEKMLATIDSGRTPLRISEVPYIKHKHNEISPDVFKRKSVRSRGNCVACHRKAGQGIYDQAVVIPKGQTG
jgi:hypothetical protein